MLTKSLHEGLLICSRCQRARAIRTSPCNQILDARYSQRYSTSAEPSTGGVDVAKDQTSDASIVSTTSLNYRKLFTGKSARKSSPDGKKGVSIETANNETNDVPPHVENIESSSLLPKSAKRGLKSKSKRKLALAKRRNNPSDTSRDFFRRTSSLPKDDSQTPPQAGSLKTSNSKRTGRKSHMQDFQPFKLHDAKIQAIPNDMPPIPQLAHGLDRALFNPGVVQLRDLHSRVYNFDPYLEKIAPPVDIDFNTLKSFTPSSKDQNMSRIALENHKRYAGSTSSLTGVLKHFHYLLSAFRPLFLENLSRIIRDKLPSSFTQIQKAPSGVFLRWRDGFYSIDSDKTSDTPNVLGMMGRYLEKLLTKNVPEFEQHKKNCPNPPSPEEDLDPESHHYSSIANILMRSQLDAYDPRLPGTGVFDLKTRAVLPIRMDSESFPRMLGYELRSLQGYTESFEREYVDMARSTLLKYSLQARIGRMDGIFVAYHNIDRLFGFQYIPIAEMDLVLHGQRRKTLGDTEFVYSVNLLSHVFDQITMRFPEQSLRILFDSHPLPSGATTMNIFAYPVTEEDIEQSQQSKQEKTEEWEQAFLQSGIPPPVSALTGTDPSSPHSGQAQDTRADSSSESTLDTNKKDLLHMRLEIRSIFQGQEVLRPERLNRRADWQLYYKLTTTDDPKKAQAHYEITKQRQEGTLEKKGNEISNYFEQQLQRSLDSSKKWRRARDTTDEIAEQEHGGIFVWNSQTPVRREEFNAL